MTCSDKFLIDQLHRFVEENDRVPAHYNMQSKYGYPSYMTYKRHFGTWNDALKKAGLKINKTQPKLDGSEVCSYCKCTIDETRMWYYINNERYCEKHGAGGLRCYMKRKLNPESSVGKGFITQRVVAKTLNIPIKNDCNCRDGFNSPVDLWDDGRYNYIDVKSYTLYENYWSFDLRSKQTPDTYILVGYDKNRKNILKVWIIDALDDLIYKKKCMTITNVNKGLSRVKHLEVDYKLYNNTYQKMKKKFKENKGINCIIGY